MHQYSERKPFIIPLFYHTDKDQKKYSEQFVGFLIIPAFCVYTHTCMHACTEHSLLTQNGRAMPVIELAQTI